MTPAITAFLVGFAFGFIVWTVAYRCGHITGYEAGRADAEENAYADATDLMDTLMAQDAKR